MTSVALSFDEAREREHTVECPYAGLDPYTAELRDYFFGRSRETQVIAANLYASPLTVLYGTSGVGKSSVLLAGVLPDLARSEDVIAIAVREWQGDSFAADIKNALLAALRVRKLSTDDIDARLPFDRVLQDCGKRFTGMFFFLFDQFEEYFLYNAAERAEGFDAEFARAVNRTDVRAHFLVSMREDELTRLDRLNKRIPNLLTNRLRLKGLDKQSAKDAITKPIEMFASRNPEKPIPRSVEPALVDALVTSQVRFDAAGLGGNVPGDVMSGRDAEERLIEMPFLQLVLTELWDKEVTNKATALRFKTYDDLDGANGIVRGYVTGVLAKEKAEVQRVAYKAFQYLVTPSGTKIAYSSADLAGAIEKPEAEVKQLIGRLSGTTRIFRRVVSRGESGVEIERCELAHDCLAPAILEWRAEYRVNLKAEQVVRWVMAGGAVVGIVFAAILWSARQTSLGFEVKGLVDAASHEIDRNPVAAAALAVEASDLSRKVYWDRQPLQSKTDSLLRATYGAPLVQALRIPGRAMDVQFVDGDSIVLVRTFTSLMLFQLGRTEPLYSTSGGFVGVDTASRRLLLSLRDSLIVWKPVVIPDGKPWRADTVMHPGPGKHFYGLAVFGGGRLFASTVLDSAGDRSEAVFDATTLQPVTVAPTDRFPRVQSAGDYVVLDTLGQIRLLNRRSGAARPIPSMNTRGGSYGFTPDGQWFVYSLFGVYALHLDPMLKGTPQQISQATFSQLSPDGQFLVVPSGGELLVYAAGNWTTPAHHFAGAPGGFSRDGQAYLSVTQPVTASAVAQYLVPGASQNKTVTTIWRTQNWTARARFDDSSHARAINFTPRFSLPWALITGAADHRDSLRILDVTRDSDLFAIPVSRAVISLPSFSRTEQYAAFYSADSIVRIYRFRAPACVPCKTADWRRGLELRLTGLTADARRKILDTR